MCGPWPDHCPVACPSAAAQLMCAADLSLAEVDKGLKVLLGDEVSQITKPAAIRAFQAAKDSIGDKAASAGDYVTRAEFRLLLVYLKRYFELLAAFDAVDTGNDRPATLRFACPSTGLNRLEPAAVTLARLPGRTRRVKASREDVAARGSLRESLVRAMTHGRIVDTVYTLYFIRRPHSRHS